MIRLRRWAWDCFDDETPFTVGALVLERLRILALTVAHSDELASDSLYSSIFAQTFSYSELAESDVVYNSLWADRMFHTGFLDKDLDVDNSLVAFSVMSDSLMEEDSSVTSNLDLDLTSSSEKETDVTHSQELDLEVKQSSVFEKDS